MTADGSHSYSYDTEGRLSQVDSGSTASYIYDAGGRRVRRTTATGGTVDYLYGLDGHEIAEVSSSGSWNRGEVYLAGRHVAVYSGGSSGTTYFNFADWLGTERARALSGASSACETIAGLPFGDGQTITSSCGDSSPMHFTGKERDSESGLDNFGARYNSSQYGRFMSPDPTGIFLGNMTDPQQLNLYSYVRNNPLSFVDPAGTDCVYLDDSGGTGDGASIDNNSNQQECWGNGGAWANGTIHSLNDVHPDSNDDWVSITSQENGDYGKTKALPGTTSIGGPTHYNAVDALMGSMASAKANAIAQQNQPPTNQQYIRAIANAVPTICGGGAFAFLGLGGDAGVANGFSGGTLEFDTRSGWSRGILTEGSVGGTGVGHVSGPNGASQTFAFQEGLDTGAVNAGLVVTGSAIGPYVESQGPVVGGAGLYANVTSAAGCHP